MKLLEWLWDAAAKLWGDGRYIMLVLFLLGILVAFGAVVWVFWFLVDLALDHLDFLLLVVGIPVALCFGIRYALHNHQPSTVEPPTWDAAALRAKAEELYPVMRDAAYLILQDVSDYTTIVRPGRLSSVESAHRFRLLDNVIVYDFTAAVSGPVEIRALREQLQRHVAQRLRTRELPGFTSEVFVSKSGRPYSVIQCFSVVDFQDFVQISLIFCDETAVTLLESKERAEIEVRRVQPRDPDF